MKSSNLDPSSSNDPNDQLSWLWPESTTRTSMAGLYIHPSSFMGPGAILTPPNNAPRGEKGEGGSSGGSTLTPTISNSSHMSMNSSAGVYGNGSTPNFIATEPHPGTLISTLESPLGSPTGTRKTSVFSTAAGNSKASPFRFISGRRFHSDEACVYVLPCDIPELTRQGLKHHLFREVFGGYHMADFSDPKKIPSKVLDIGCGTGIWIASMHDEFAAKGRDDVKFVGMDIVPVYAPMTDVDFTFVRHNCLSFPYPFKDGEFDYIFIRDVTLAIPDTSISSDMVVECLRVLREGGTLEIQCSKYLRIASNFHGLLLILAADHSIRSLSQTKAPRTECGTYTITTATQFEAQPKNTHVQFFNTRLRRLLSKRGLSPTPCTSIGMLLSMEDCLTNNHSVRYALPLDKIWWETGSGRDDSPTSERGGGAELNRKNSVGAKNTLNQSSVLSENDMALRYQAKLQVKQFVDALEPHWIEVRDLPGEDFSKPYKEMTMSFFQEGGLRNGECLEFGAWWSTKKTC